MEKLNESGMKIGQEIYSAQQAADAAGLELGQNRLPVPIDERPLGPSQALAPGAFAGGLDDLADPDGDLQALDTTQRTGSEEILGLDADDGVRPQSGLFNLALGGLGPSRVEPQQRLRRHGPLQRLGEGNQLGSGGT